MIDTHCHIQTEAFDADREEVLQRALEAGVDYLLVPAIDRGSFDATLRVSREHRNVFCALGIHPHHAIEWNAEVATTIRQRVEESNRVVAIGEIGLDYHYDFCPKDVQKLAFEQQIELAKSLREPIIIHTRESDEDVLEIVERQYPDHQRLPTGQFHCFSGTLKTLHKALSLGFYVSFTGNITFKNSTLKEAVNEAPLERILLETDSPYMTPVPLRGKRNEPSYLPRIAEKIAEIKGIDVKEVMTQTLKNAKTLFSLPIAALFVVLLTLCAPARAQRTEPVGSQPPDSVMNDERRGAEEQIRKQQEEMRKEAAKKTQDSLVEIQKEQLEEHEKVVQQMREDSIKAVERLQQIERDSLRANTPIAWKAIGIGGAVGIGNMPLSQNKQTITTTSVLATSFQINTQITRVIDFEFSWMRMRVGDNFDSLYNAGLKYGTTPLTTGQTIPNGSNLPYREDFYVSALAFDVRFAIAPRNPFKFYAGLGYTYLIMENDQLYNTEIGSPNLMRSAQSYTFDSKFDRSAIDVLFGVRYDYELSSEFILSPFAEISALFALQGQTQDPPFVFRTDPTLITMTHFRMGVTLNFGWFTSTRFR